MDIFTIINLLRRGSSNLTCIDVLESKIFLERIGYELVRMLGCGSYGAVILAKDKSDSSNYAIKVMSAKSKE